MKSLIYDTETTGLPDWSKPSEDPCQPRITQICAELVDDETGEVYASLHTLIKPDGWTIPPELEELTGITTEKCADVGLSMAQVLPMFVDMWTKSYQRVAHNESFDMRMVRIELMRHIDLSLPLTDGNLPADIWKAGLAFCTCNAAKPIVNLPPSPKMVAKGMNTPKPPNLGEAYFHFTGLKLEGAHNAAVDVMACKEIYFKLRELQRQAA